MTLAAHSGSGYAPKVRSEEETQRDLWAQLWLDEQEIVTKLNAKLVMQMRERGFFLKRVDFAGLRTSESFQFTTCYVDSVWLHRECPTEITVGVALTAVWHPRSFGQLQLSLDICDDLEDYRNTGVGVVGPERVLTSSWVSDARPGLATFPTNEATRDAWFAHMTQSLESLTESDLDGLVADVVAQLEAVASC